MRPLVRSFLLPAAVAGTFTACHKTPAAPPPAPAPTQTPAPPPAPVRPVTTEAPHPAAPAGPTEAEINAAIMRVKNTLGAQVYFDYDKDALRDEAKSRLDEKVAVLKEYPQVRIRIDGNTDERGSAEYNIALGQRRAAAAQRYLAGRGIDMGRIDIVSFGEEKPAMTGESEASWSKNRRDEFEIVGGADQIRPRMGR